MRERTPLISVGVEGTLPSQNPRLPVTLLLEATTGIIFYHGGDILTNEQKKSVEVYVGVREELISHAHMVEGDGYFAGPFLGVGHTMFVKTSGPEIWNVLYTRLGVETAFRVSRTQLFANAGVVVPVLALDHGLHVNINYEDGLYIPHGRASLFCEVGAKFGDGPTMSIAYDSMRLSQSASVNSHQLFGSKTQAFLQPDTKSYTISLKVSYRFGRK